MSGITLEPTIMNDGKAFFVNLWIDCVCYLFAIYLKCWRKLLPTNVFSLLLTKREKREALSQFRGSGKFFESAGSRDLRTRSHWRNMRMCCRYSKLCPMDTIQHIAINGFPLHVILYKIENATLSFKWNTFTHTDGVQYLQTDNCHWRWYFKKTRVPLPHTITGFQNVLYVQSQVVRFDVFSLCEQLKKVQVSDKIASPRPGHFSLQLSMP